MVFHLFGFQWKPGVTEEEKDRRPRDPGPAGEVPGLIETHVGVNCSPRSLGYAFGGVMKFRIGRRLRRTGRIPLTGNYSSG